MCATWHNVVDVVNFTIYIYNKTNIVGVVGARWPRLVHGFEHSGKESLSFPLLGKHKFRKHFPDIGESMG
ncbi:hypothetical protein LguiB_010085 [Lonicera macranthoides]